MKTRGAFGNVPSACGLAWAGFFARPRLDAIDYPLLTKERMRSGTGFFVVGFIKNKACKKAYEEFCKEFQLVYQSPVRLNTNSNNLFFFCIFDKRK